MAITSEDLTVWKIKKVTSYLHENLLFIMSYKVLFVFYFQLRITYYKVSLKFKNKSFYKK